MVEETRITRIDT
jgi:hypothetical protein